MKAQKAQCDKVAELGEDGFIFSDGGTSGWNLLPWIWSFGGDITDVDITTATDYVNGEKTVEAIQFLADMIKSGCFSDGFLASGIDTWAGYFGGTIGSMMEGPWLYPTVDSQGPDFEVGAALMPAGEGGHISVVGGENIVVLAGTKHPDEALEFIKFTKR